VYDGGPAQAAGLSAGDLLLAIDGLRVTPSPPSNACCAGAKPAKRSACTLFAATN
jgi:predicted metalloprotease with PDZ domain